MGGLLCFLRDVVVFGSLLDLFLAWFVFFFHKITRELLFFVEDILICMLQTHKLTSLYFTSGDQHWMWVCQLWTESQNDFQPQETAEITVKWLPWALYASRCLQICRALETKVSQSLYFYLALFKIIFSLTYEPSGYIPLFYLLHCMLKNPPDNLLLYARDKTFTKLQTAGTHFSMNFGCLLEIPRTKNWIKVLLEALLHSSAIYTIRLKINLPLFVNAQ